MDQTQMSIVIIGIIAMLMGTCAIGQSKGEDIACDNHCITENHHDGFFHEEQKKCVCRDLVVEPVEKETKQ